METKPRIVCPKCGDSSSLVCHGKRYAVYPAGCVYLISLPFALLHQASTPADWECKACGSTFSRRDTLAKVAVGLIALICAIFLVLGAFALIQ